MAADTSGKAPLDGVLPDPALFGSLVARNVFLLELTQLVLESDRPKREAVDFLERCAAALDVPSDRCRRFKSFAAPQEAAGSASAGELEVEHEVLEERELGGPALGDPQGDDLVGRGDRRVVHLVGDLGSSGIVSPRRGHARPRALDELLVDLRACARRARGPAAPLSMRNVWANAGSEPSVVRNARTRMRVRNTGSSTSSAAASISARSTWTPRSYPRRKHSSLSLKWS